MNSNSSYNPVLLIHGIFRKSGIFNKMSGYLTQLGWSVYSLDLAPNWGNTSLEELALQLADYIDTNFDPQQPLDLVGLSMGGLVARYYLQRLGGINRVQRFIALSSPHSGTWTAYTLWGKGCVQMRPGSVFLEDLNRDANLLKKVNFTSIWTPWDFIIVPASSSQISAAKDVKLSVFAHAMMARNSRSLTAVAEALSEPLQVHH
ncbi:MAG: alpha/beta fold hydrolase [Oscillatoriales cyanobacterium]|uniref:Alpha/beta fold hydrolase n=1 Tax=Microcoleus anatoxicus PTRS2 TaxID=2705321 RepID=A0ABU8YQC8_9CYAN|nr:MAG: alpha/beta fold hydrolase [Oscillatoriales cyanobacterium]TAD92994.1 MAG: alpha/beta fold hydrolase [Oscillatoriales cyanobacterium]TAE02128.1 MAG: alpha/beta fold hydrolase [Oscillatoriales cyanobacterium]TAF06024.1 MAG: alpha/beta fold hydrolase [Oscillatoriales cyanobacterium]TAF64620.1 MAG: alpha/beta fold hydrolase [Oscillatoriales cyanobacterium]